MKNYMLLFFMLFTFTLISCQTKTPVAVNTSLHGIEKKEAGVENKKLIGLWAYEASGCVNDKEITEKIYVNIEAFGNVDIRGNSFECNQCWQKFKITDKSFLPANCEKSLNGGGFTFSSPVCTQLYCMAEPCANNITLKLERMDYKLEGDQLIIHQNGHKFVLTRHKEPVD